MVVCAGVFAFILWTAIALVAPGEWLRVDPPMEPVHSLGDCLPRIALMYLAISLIASNSAETTTRGTTSSYCQLLGRLPVSDKTIRRLESPCRAWPYLFAYTLLVFATLEWHHGRNDLISFAMVPLFALGHTCASLALSGIAKGFMPRRARLVSLLIALIGMPSLMFCVFIPSDTLRLLRIGDTLLRMLPTGWMLVAWHDGWLQREAVPYLWFLPVVALWLIERWRVDTLPISLEEITGASTHSSQRPSRHTARSPFGQTARDLAMVVNRELEMNSPGAGMTSWQNRWLHWPMKHRDQIIMQSLHLIGERPVRFRWVVLTLVITIPFGRLLTWLTQHAYYSPFPDVAIVLATLLFVAWYGPTKCDASDNSFTSRPLNLPIGFDEAMAAGLRTSLAFAKRFLPGQAIFALILVGFDHLSTWLAVEVALAPIVLWVLVLPTLMAIAFHVESFPLIVLSGVLVFLSTFAVFGLLFAPRVPTVLQAVAAIAVAAWVFAVILRWAYLGGHFERFSQRSK
ncbi:MAG: hypothetical protein KDB23_00090 [Planctomycetales bacterium]|nr:hypothetical protein [Planctomycetales bacterium]